MADFEKAFLLTVAFEGGDVNDPDDRGGRTRYGISQRAYPALTFPRSRWKPPRRFTEGIIGASAAATG